MPVKVADVYVTSNRPQRCIPTTPGRSVSFRGGHAEVWRDEDMPHMLRIPDAVVRPVEAKIDWLPAWISQCGAFNTPQATVEFPDGVLLKPPYKTAAVAPEATNDDVPAKRIGRPPKGGWTVVDEPNSGPVSP